MNTEKYMRLYCYKFAASILYFILVFTNGCSKHQQVQTDTTQPIEVQPSNETTNETTANEVSPLNRQIHDYFQIIGEDLESKYGIEKGEALGSIATAKEFKKTIIEVCRIYDQIENPKMNFHFSDAEIDALNVKRFKDIRLRRTGRRLVF